MPLSIGKASYRVRGYLASHLATDMSHEPQVLPVLEKALARHGAFVDVGANVGQSLLKMLTIDPERRYVGFEPQVSCCSCIERFIEDNGLRATILPLALSDSNGVLTLSRHDPFSETASLLPTDGVEGKISVPTAIGDEILEALDLEEIAVIKIDVEGAELPVLRGLTRSIDRHHPHVFFEVLPNFSGHDRVPIPEDQAAENQASADGIWAFFSERDYEIHKIRDRGGSYVIDRFELDEAEAFDGFNYVALPQSGW